MDVVSELSLDSIQQRLRQRQDLFRQQYRITEMGIFGSYARGEQTAASDVDVLVVAGMPLKPAKDIAKEIGLERKQ